MTVIPPNIYNQYADYARNQTQNVIPATNNQSASIFPQNSSISSNPLMDQCKKMEDQTNKLIRDCASGSPAMGAPQIPTATNPFAGAGAISNPNSGVTAVKSSAPVNGIKEATAGTYGGVALSAEQTKNAKIIAEVGKKMGASKHDIAIALATAMQESQLKNLDYGDRDSLGLFQQRPSCGWGTEAQIQDPAYAAGKFFEGLLKVKNRDNMSLTAAAQEVQRSGFPDAYAQWEGMAGALTDNIVA